MTDEAVALRQTGAAPLRPADPEHIGPYVPLALLGSGGMGRVYLARPSDDSPGLYAVKVIRPEYAEDPRFRRRFEQEAAVHRQVRTPRAPRLCGTGFQDELLWMATEYLAALDLADAVREGGALGPGAVWRLVAELGQALADLAATGIVHRDLKPSNVLLSVEGAHVIDFGISKAADASSITGTGNRVGTPAYMSPEYLRTGLCDPASDVFSLAGTLIYAAAGRAPFGDGTGVDVMHRVAFEEPDAEVIGEITAADPALGALLAACLAKEPERRPTPTALIEAARAATARGATLGSPAGEQVGADGWPGRREASPSGRAGGSAAGSAPIEAARPAPGSPADQQAGADGRRVHREADPNERAGASTWPEPLLGRVLERQRAYDVLYRVPVERAAELRFPGHRPKSTPPAEPVRVSAEPGPAEAPGPAVGPAVPSAGTGPGAGASVSPVAPVAPAAPSAETSPGQRRPSSALTWIRRRPVPAAVAGLAVCALAALTLVLARPEAHETASPPGAAATPSADTAVQAGASPPTPGTSDGKSLPSTSGSGSGNATVDGPAAPSPVPGVTGEDAAQTPGTAGTPTATDTDPDGGTDPGTDGGTSATPSATPTSVSSPTEPATAPWVTECTYYAGKARTVIGDTGKRVKQVQCILLKRGYDIGGTGVDGVFGEGLEAAVISFQNDKGLTADGIVKQATWPVLRATK